MKSKYIVGASESSFEEGGFCILEANSEEDAIHEFVRKFGIRQEGFQEHIYSRTTNASFAEEFWLEEEVESFIDGGSLLSKKEEFNQRVREFFGEHEEYSEMYISFYWGDKTIKYSFPEEMLMFMWFNSNWSNTSAFKLTDIQES